MSAPGTESIQLGQRSLSASNEISTIRFEMVMILFAQLDGECLTSRGISFQRY